MAEATAATGYLSFSEDRDIYSRSSQSANAEREAMSSVSKGCIDYTDMSLQIGCLTKASQVKPTNAAEGSFKKASTFAD